MLSFSYIISATFQINIKHHGVFPRWKGYSVKLLNHCSMNGAKFKDPVSHMCLACAMVTFWSLTQEVTGLDNHFKYNIFVTTFSKTFNPSCLEQDFSQSEIKYVLHQHFVTIGQLTTPQTEVSSGLSEHIYFPNTGWARLIRTRLIRSST